jgi:signal transduction histidine kinase
MLSARLQQDVERVGAIDAVPRILDVVCRTTGMGFSAVARVTEQHWVCCSSLDLIGFGLKAGGELEIATTICNEIRASGQAVVIDHVAEDDAFCGHPTPAMYGFQSYISVPIVLADGRFFGTLCAIDPRPARLRGTGALAMFELHAQLIAFYLDAQDRLQASESALLDARQTEQLREEFIAVLGHDLRNPLQTLRMGLSVIGRAPERAASMLPVLDKSVQRMGELVDNLTDFARGRLGGGLRTGERVPVDLQPVLAHVVHEARAGAPGREVTLDAQLAQPVTCDPQRISQLLSNLLGNALRYGRPDRPVRVHAASGGGTFELSVANEGPPIPQAARGQLFQPFVRGPAGTNAEGLGLGLYIVSEIARAHGGRMELASDDAETRFTLRMPATG